MPLFFRRRIVALGAPFNYSNWLTKHFPLADRFDHQDLSGSSVLEASYTTSLATGRNVATLTYAAYTPGANWANSSAQIARHTAGAVATIQQDGIIAAGKTWEYIVVMSNRTAGSVAITGGDVTVSSNGSTTVTITATGADVIITPSSDFDGDIDLAQGTVKQTGILASSAYTPGTNPMDGLTVAAQVGVPTNFGSLGLSVVDDGAASFSDIHSAEINSKFNPAAGFVNIWAKVSGAGVWTDSVNRWLERLAADDNNQVFFFKAAADNLFVLRYEANNIVSVITLTDHSPVDWTMYTVTWDTSANGGLGEVKVYLNGVQSGATLTNLGVWVGNLSDTETVIGAEDTIPTGVWDGSRTRLMVGYDLPVPTPAQVLSLYNQGIR